MGSRDRQFNSWLRVHWWFASTALIGVACAGFLLVSLSIGWQVDRVVTQAQLVHPGSPIAALIALVESEDAELADRNRAVWALGQLGAEEAVPALRSLEAGEGCVHESRVCQREVRKAIAACSGGFNPGAVVWRHGRLAQR